MCIEEHAANCKIVIYTSFIMDLSGKTFFPADSYLHNANSLVSAYGIGSALVNSQMALANSMFSNHALTSPAYSVGLTSLLSHTTLSNGHKISLHSTDKSEGGGAKSQIYSSPSPVFNRHKDTFPYGISGVSVPSYNYHGDVYQFTSNGYPRKSRTCSYCGKVFTRSTTRRYHEKRCPLLRAAVSSYIGEDNFVSGAAATQSQARVQELNTLSYKGQGQILGPSVSGITQSSEISTSILAKYPSGSNKHASRECLLSGYQTSVIVKQEPHELEALSSMASNSTNSFKKQYSSSLKNTSKIVLCVSPEESNDRDNYDIDTNVSAGYDPGLDLSLCKSHTSNISGSVTAKSSSYLCGQFAMETDEGLDLNQKPLSSMSLLQHTRYKIDLQNYEESENKVEEDEEKEEINYNVKGQKSEIDICDAADVETYSVTSEKKDGKVFGSHKCGICGKSFESLSKLHLHEQLHTKFKPYSCKFCGQKFARSAQKVEHEKTHNGSELAHICAVCGSSFTRKYSLKLHMRRWHQEGPWLCRHCGKASLMQMELKMHLYSHNLPKHERESLLYMPDTPHSYGAAVDSGEGDEKEFEGESRPVVKSQCKDIPAIHEVEMCHECGRNFPNGYLRYHLKSHEAQKPYSCPICAKKFGYKNNMKSHIKLHTGIKPFQCKVCGAKFTRGSTLRRHARRHGINADSVWDLFVKPDYNKSDAGQTHKHDTLITSRPEANVSVSSQTHSGSSGGENGESNYLISTVSTPNHGSLYPMYASLEQLPHVSLYSGLSASTSYLAHLPHSLIYTASSQLHPQQLDALNLSVNKIATGDQHSDLSSYSNVSTEHSRSRSHSLSSSGTRKYPATDKQLSHNVGVQVHTCCRQQKCDLSAGEFLNFDHPGSDRPLTSPILSNSPSSMSLVPYIVTSPSLWPSNVDSTSPALSVSSKQDYSLETISSLIGSGRMFKCFHCECYFSEYAMYRIHSKLHINDVTHPFVCMVCGEDCHDRVYFTLHLSEHLR